MRPISSRLISVCSLLLLLLVTVAGQNSSSSEPIELLPKTVGAFRAQSTRAPASEAKTEGLEHFGARDAAENTYVSPKGERLSVTVVMTQSHAGAYALMTRAAAEMRSAGQAQATKAGDVGVAGIAAPDRVAFYKGPVFINITGKTKPGRDGENVLLSFARDYAKTLPEAENEIPVLVKHLPDWETAQERAVYAVSLQSLQEAAGQQPIFEAINFKEGAEAVTTTYDTSRLVVVEYHTPQIATEADARITGRLQGLRTQGQPVPSAYRRVGNYSVFVFNAPDETAAAQLIDRIKYEQNIQWLGENPLLWARAEKQHTREAVSLILGVAKLLGFFVMICVGVGGLFGGVAFLHRRAQQRNNGPAEAYSDAGGMLRLNIDGMTAETDPSRLLGTGEEKSVV